MEHINDILSYRTPLIMLQEGEDPLTKVVPMLIATASRKIIYVTLQKSKAYILEVLDKQNIKTDTLSFIDGVSAYYKPIPNEENCTYVSAPYEFDELSIAIQSHIAKQSLILFDSLSTLLRYNYAIPAGTNKLRNWLSTFENSLNKTKSTIVFFGNVQDNVKKAFQESLPMYDAIWSAKDASKLAVDMHTTRSEQPSFLVLVPAYKYRQALANYFKPLIEKKIVCYITMTQSADHIVEFLKKNDIFPSNTHIIDATPKTKEEISNLEVTYVSSALSIPQILNKITFIVNKMHPQIVIFDSLSTLISLQHTPDIQSCLQQFVVYLSKMGVKCILLAIKEDKYKETVMHLSLVVDQTIEL